ncbi:hypothetical protein ACTFIZ_009749 [Dictyostelium cf. discoideum]
MDYLNSYLKIRDSIIDSINKKNNRSNIFSLIDIYDKNIDYIKINRLMNFLYFPNKVSGCDEVVDNDLFDNEDSSKSSKETTMDIYIKTPIFNEEENDDDYEEDDEEDEEVQEDKIKEDQITFCQNTYIYINNIKYGKIYSPDFNELLKIATSINKNDNYKIIGNNYDLVIPYFKSFYALHIIGNTFSRKKDQIDFIKLHIFKRPNDNIDTNGVKLDGIQQEYQIISKWLTVENEKRFMCKLFIPIGSDGDEIEIRHNLSKICEKLSISESGMLFDYYKYSIKYCVLPDNDITIFINSNNRNQYIGLLEFDIFIMDPYLTDPFESPSIESIGFRNLPIKIMKNEFDKQLNKGNQIGMVLYNLYTTSDWVEKLSGMDLYLCNSLINHYGTNNIKMVSLIKSNNTIFNVYDINEIKLSNVLIFSNGPLLNHRISGSYNPSEYENSRMFSVITITNENSNVSNNPSVQIPYIVSKKQKFNHQQVVKTKISGNSFKLSNLLTLKIINYSIDYSKKDEKFFTFCQSLHLVCKQWNNFILSKIKFSNLVSAPKNYIQSYLNFNTLFENMLCKKERTLDKYSTIDIYQNTLKIYKLLFQFYFPGLEFQNNPKSSNQNEYLTQTVFLLHKDYQQREKTSNNPSNAFTLYDNDYGYLNLNNPTSIETLMEQKQVHEIQFNLIKLLKDEILKIINDKSKTVALTLQFLYSSNNQLCGSDLVMWNMLNQIFNNNEFQLNISTYIASKNKVKNEFIDKFHIIDGDIVNYKYLSKPIEPSITTSTTVTSTSSIRTTVETTIKTTTEFIKSTIIFKNPTFTCLTPIFYNYVKSRTQKSYENVGCFSAISICKK